MFHKPKISLSSITYFLLGNRLTDTFTLNIVNNIILYNTYYAAHYHFIKTKIETSGRFIYEHNL